MPQGGHANFFVSPQIWKPQILWLIPQSQIRKFLSCSHSANRNSTLNLLIRKSTNFPACKISKFASNKAVFLIKIRSGLSLIFFYLSTHPLASPRRTWPAIGRSAPTVGCGEKSGRKQCLLASLLRKLLPSPPTTIPSALITSCCRAARAAAACEGRRETPGWRPCTWKGEWQHACRRNLPFQSTNVQGKPKWQQLGRQDVFSAGKVYLFSIHTISQNSAP